MAEHSDGALPRRGQVRQPDCFLGEFDPTMWDPADRCSASHWHTSLPVQCTQAGRRSVFPRASASGTHGRRGTARQAPTASHVRRSVPRLAPCIGHSGAAIT